MRLDGVAKSPEKDALVARLTEVEYAVHRMYRLEIFQATQQNAFSAMLHAVHALELG